MKRITLILLVALVAFSSCKKEDEVTTSSNCGEITTVYYTNSYGQYLVYWESYDGETDSFFLDDNGNKVVAGDQYCK